MGFFSDHKQQELDAAAQIMYNDMTGFSSLLDCSNGVMTASVKLYAEKAENSIVSFCQTCKRYEATHNFVKWAGQQTMVTGVLMAVSGFANEVMKTTGYRFTKL